MICHALRPRHDSEQANPRVPTASQPFSLVACRARVTLRGMGWRYRILLLVIIIVAASVGLWAYSRQPSYEGKTVGVWLNDFCPGVDSQKGREALGVIGPEAAPYIFAKLRANPPSAFTLKYRVLRAKAPHAIQRLLPTPKESFQPVSAVNALVATGPSVIPVLTKSLIDRNADVRMACAWALGSFARKGTNTSGALSALVFALQDANPYVRQ